MLEINLRDDKTGLEFSIECDTEKGLLYGWRVICSEPMPLQNALNLPFLLRQPTAQGSPCQQKAMQAERPPLPTGVSYPNVQQQRATTKDGSYVVRRVKLSPETGEPIIDGAA